MNRYPLWKYLLVLGVFLLGLLYALPNLFGEDPAVQLSAPNGRPVPAAMADQVRDLLRRTDIPVRGLESADGRLLVRLPDQDEQLATRELLAREFEDAVVALNLAPRTPAWLRALGAEPMALGLDLRGGVHFLMEVDMAAALQQRLESLEADARRVLREAGVRYAGISRSGERIVIRLREPADVAQARETLGEALPELTLDGGEADSLRLIGTLDAQTREQVRDFALDQNITTLRNRVNELGVAEPVIQQQGDSRIVVQLPGVQDTARAKEILGATATLEFRLVDSEGDAYAAERTGRTPIGSRLYRERDGGPILLQREVIVTGDQLIDATAGFDQQSGSPAVFVTLDARGARRMGETTRQHLGEPMAVVFIENKVDVERVDGELVKRRRTVEEVISVATIQGVFSKRFQITGLAQEEARTLSLLLRAGALAAPVDIVEERTVGPSLGQRNIQQGFTAVAIGLLLVAVFMVVYYRVFGLIADLALVVNLVLIVAVLSLLQATLTLPGIAGLVLTVGMAVDANVLIFERIREELRIGNTPQAAIQRGYAKAFSTIADANVTTLIAAVVLFGLGSGPVRGFAVTLSIGILTSMFTAIMGTRAMVNLIYGNRRLRGLAI